MFPLVLLTLVEYVYNSCNLLNNGAFAPFTFWCDLYRLLVLQWTFISLSDPRSNGKLQERKDVARLFDMWMRFPLFKSQKHWDEKGTSPWDGCPTWEYTYPACCLGLCKEGSLMELWKSGVPSGMRERDHMSPPRLTQEKILIVGPSGSMSSHQFIPSLANCGDELSPAEVCRGK